MKNASILGITISPTSYTKTLHRIRQLIQNNEKKYVCVAAVHLIMECQKNSLLRKGINNSEITTPDGMPLVWLLKLFGYNTQKRVYDPTLMHKICALAQKHTYSIYLLGGALSQSSELAEKLKHIYPRLSIAGFSDTPGKQLTKKANQKIIRSINESHARIVFVGMGCPHQELWMIQNRKKLAANVLIGVGAAFNILTGKEKQAPSILQNNGLEWLFRLIQNPKRLWRRYTFTNATFIWKMLRTHMR